MLSRVSLLPDMVDDIYEQMFLEMIEKGERPLCLRLLRETTVFLDMKNRNPLSNVRFRRLESLANSSSPDVDLYKSSTRAERRKAISSRVMESLTEGPPSRLNLLIREALLYGRTTGKYPLTHCQVDLLTGVCSEIEKPTDIISQIRHLVKFPKGSVPNCCSFTDDRLVTGSSCGLVEIWVRETGNLDNSLAYQTNGQNIVHATAISSIDTDPSGKFVVCGDIMGNLRLWEIAKGECIKEFSSVHKDPVSAVCFSKSETPFIISASTGGDLKVIGIKAGRVLREYPTYSGYVTTIAIQLDGSIATGWSDGMVRVFASGSSPIIHQFHPGLAEDGSCQSVQISSLVPVRSARTDQQEMLLIGTRGSKVYLASQRGTIIRTFTISSPGDQFTSCTTSDKSDFFHCASVLGNLYTYAFANEEPTNVLKVSDTELNFIQQNSKHGEIAACCPKYGVYILGS